MTDNTFSPIDLSFLVAIVISIIIMGFTSVVLYKIFKGDIRLEGIIQEPADPKNPDRKPKASLSRFQFLIFTFVIAGLYLVLSLESGNFVDVPESALVLLGISGGSFLISKGIGGGKQGNGNNLAPANGNGQKTDNG